MKKLLFIPISFLCIASFGQNTRDTIKVLITYYDGNALKTVNGFCAGESKNGKLAPVIYLDDKKKRIFLPIIKATHRQ
jgi:hypothetical protein